MKYTLPQFQNVSIYDINMAKELDMLKSNFYRYLMDYAYNNSAEVIQSCGCANGCSHPSGICPSTRDALCWSKCFNEIYQPDNNKNGRLKYNCPKLVNQYVYRQLDKHASEIFHALVSFCSNKIKAYENFNVLSLGCGPATELVAIEYFNEISSLNKQINYYGLEIENTWDIIQKKIQEYTENDTFLRNVNFLQNDAIKLLDIEILTDKKFNLIILNYIISSLIADGNDDKISELFSNLAKLIIKNQINDCIFIINDMNLDIRGLNKFIDLLESLKNNNIEIFSYEPKYFYHHRLEPYGEKYLNNKTIFETHYDKTAFRNNTCTSAQLLIHAGKS